MVLNQGIQPYLSQPGAQLITVSGFGAVQLPARPASPEQGCIVRLDVASGQSAWVSFTSDGPIRAHLRRDVREGRSASASVLAQLLARIPLTASKPASRGSQHTESAFSAHPDG